eukprot:COSAG01_NODE_11967_length_1825_cov_1.666280_1_plen_368_part_00
MWCGTAAMPPLLLLAVAEVTFMKCTAAPRAVGAAADGAVRTTAGAGVVGAGAGATATGASAQRQLPPVPATCPTEGCFPCTGCLCKPTFDGGSPLPKAKCINVTGASCPRTDNISLGQLQRQSDMVYGSAPNEKTGEMQTLRLNLYQPPASDMRKLRPAALCMTGGGFRTGDRNKFSTNNWAKHFASRGFVAITIDYRLGHSPGVPENRDAAYDAKAAVRWLVKHSKELRISTDHIVAFGSSAGGMTVAWLTAVREGNSGNAGYASNITAGISLSGFLYNQEFPHVRAGQVPYLDFHGTADPTVPLPLAEATHEIFVRKGNPAAIIKIPGAKHVPWPSLEDRSADFFGFLTTYARLGELQCPTKPSA